MRYTPAIEDLSFVMPIPDCSYLVRSVMPITDRLYSVPSVANFSFRTSVPIVEQMREADEGIDLSSEIVFSAFVSIVEQMKTRGKWIYLSSEITLDETLESEEKSREAQEINPLLALAGALVCELTDIHGTMPMEMQQTDADQSQEAQQPDPLLALAGTLRGSATDIGEHHDNYIGDVLLTELRGDKDE